MEAKISYWSIIRKRLWLIGLLFVSTVGTIIGISYMNPPVYLASVRFEVTAPPPTDVVLFSGFEYDSETEIIRTSDSFIEVLLGSTVARQVIETLQLSMNPEDLQSHIVVEQVELPEAASSNPQIKRQLMKVGVNNPDPQLSADLTNALVSVALKRYGTLRAQPKTVTREFIAAQLAATKQELDQAQEALIDFQIKNTVGDLSQAIALQQEMIYDLRRNRDLAQAEGRLDEVSTFNDLILQRGVELQDLVRLELEYASFKADVDQAKSTYGLLLEKQTEATLKENEVLNLGFIQFFGPADPPSHPQPRVQTSILALGGVLSLIIGVMIAFIWNYFEPRRPKPTIDPESGNLKTVSSTS